MKKTVIVFLCALTLMLGASTAFGAENKYEPEVMQKLFDCKYKIHALQDLAHDGVITKMQAETGINDYLKKAKEAAGHEITMNEILLLETPQTKTAELTALQKFAGYITMVNIFWVIGICLGVVCFGYLAIHYCARLIELFKEIPVIVYEFIFYLASIGFMIYGYSMDPGIGPYVSLTGCLGLAGAMTFTISMRKIRADEAGFFFILFVVYTIAALFLKSQLIGFASVIALMGALGFSAAVIPFGYAIGFKDDESLGRATAAAFVMLAAFVAMRVLGQNVQFFQYFERGALFMGSFVGFLGLLIASNRWCSREGTYLYRQLVVIVAGVLALVVGSIWQIGELQKIGGTFFVLYLVEKPFEIPVNEAKSYAFIGLFVSAMIWLGCLYAKSHPELANTFLLYSFQ